MSLFRKQYLTLLILVSVLGLQILTSAHTIDHVVEHHDHQCTFYFAEQGNDHACFTISSHIAEIPLDVFDHDTNQQSIIPVFHFNFFGRAPPIKSPV